MTRGNRDGSLVGRPGQARNGLPRCVVAERILGTCRISRLGGLGRLFHLGLQGTAIGLGKRVVAVFGKWLVTFPRAGAFTLSGFALIRGTRS